MNYYNRLSDDEIRALCLDISDRDLRKGFEAFSKDFASIKPGYRAKKLTGDLGRKLLVGNPHAALTKKMLEALLSDKVNRIDRAVEKELEKGSSETAAYMRAFADSVSPLFTKLYLRFAGKEYDDEHIELILAGAELIRAERMHTEETVQAAASTQEAETERDRQAEVIAEQDREIKAKTEEINQLREELEKERKKNLILNEEIGTIEPLKTKLTEATAAGEQLQEENDRLKLRLGEYQRLSEQNEETIRGCREELKTLRTELNGKQEQLHAWEAEREASRRRTYGETAEVLCPCDREEFRDYLSYNFSSLGLYAEKREASLLLDYLCDILFLPKPILCSQALGRTLSRCVSNALCGTQEIRVVPYRRELTTEELSRILEEEERILLLDAFIGNSSEMELLPLLRGAKGKIIFLTAEYEKTISYLLPEEVLCSCSYLCAEHIPQLLTFAALEEDPATQKEEYAPIEPPQCNRQMQRNCTEIMTQLGFSPELARVVSLQMDSEKTLAAALAFTLLPYAAKAFDASPFSTSERLCKFAGKSAYGELLMEWYADE